MLNISEQDIRQALRRDNPWWNSDYIPTRRYKHSRAYFQAFSELALNWSIKRSVILLGPRRVGKTVMLEQFVEHAISNGFSSNCIFYVSVDTPIYSGLALEELIRLFSLEAENYQHQQKLVMFDEIQYLKNWEVHLKVLTDKNPNIRFIASGSAAAALKLASQESGAGRFTEFFLPPLTFAEFLQFRELEERLISAVDVGHTLRFTVKDIDALNHQFIDYLNFGGYPEAVLNPAVQADTQRFLGRDIIEKVLLKDLPGLYGIQDIQELNRLFNTIAYNSGLEISLEKLASSSGVNKNTIKKYLQYLEAAFLIVRVRRVDDSGQTFQRDRQFKAYLTNPSMRAALFAPINPEDTDTLGPLAETAILSQWFHSNLMNHIHYARWKQGRKTLEVDMVKLNPATNFKPQWAYEIKWSDRFTDRPEELSGLLAFAKKNFDANMPVGATTKSTFSEKSVDGIMVKQFPCALHCYQIGKNLSAGRPA